MSRVPSAVSSPSTTPATWVPVRTGVGARARSLVRSAPVRQTALVFGVWTFVAFVITQQQYISLSYSPSPVPPWSRLFISGLASCWLWAAFTLPMIRLARRFRVDSGNWPIYVPLHIAIGLAFSVIDVLIDRAWSPWISPFPGDALPPILVTVVRASFLNLTCYLVIIALTYAVDYAALYRERTLATAQLSEQLSRAQLRALQSQLRPHFLFNTLNTIAEQVYTDPAGADRMITRLGALLRASFGALGDHEISLREELAFLRNYLDIMSVRFRDRVRIDIDIDPDALDSRVPTLLLQPLVENALRHGVEPMESGGHVEIVARRRIDMVVIEVRDNGAGLRADPHEGVGIRNTRDRLVQLYGEDQAFAIRDRIGGGVIAAITLPYDTGVSDAGDVR